MGQIARISARAAVVRIASDDEGLAAVRGNPIAIAISEVAGFDPACAVVTNRGGVGELAWVIADAAVSEVDTRVYTPTPVGNAFGIAGDALVRAGATRAKRHGVGHPTVGAISIDEAAQTDTGAIAEARTAARAIGLALRHRLTAAANRLDALLGRVGVDHVGVVIHGNDVARAVANLLLAISRYLRRCKCAIGGVGKSADSVLTRPIPAVGIGSRTVSGGRALRGRGGADAVRACLAARAVFRLLALGYSRGAGSIDAGLPSTALMTATAAVL